jgi:[ribosomal protein S18]-alanine N-acetyltransferase
MSAVLKPALPSSVDLCRPECLRPLAQSEMAAVMRIEQDIYAFPWTEGNFIDSMRAGYSVQGLWEHMHGGARLAGYFAWMPGVDEAHLLNLSVSRAWQRQGVGAWLLAQVMAQASAHGAKLLFLEVRPSNTAGRALYAKHGFTEVGRRKNYYPAAGGREDALVLSHPLG